MRGVAIALRGAEAEDARTPVFGEVSGPGDDEEVGVRIVLNEAHEDTVGAPVGSGIAAVTCCDNGPKSASLGDSRS